MSAETTVNKPVYFPLDGDAPFPYSQAVKYNNLIWTCGQLGTDQDGNLGHSFKEQVRLAFDNLEKALKTAGGSLHSIIKLSAFVRDINQLDEFNEVYLTRINHQAKPVRTTVQIGAFQEDILVEVDAVAYDEGQ
ncbi:RidA family protein [Neobacillus sp. 19]|uniref:RidA family protein n=1 Tax=Neobacillus sp. 19 TaxID=3394458 RepID=UPI003BF6319E